MHQLLFAFLVCLTIGLTLADQNKDLPHFKYKSSLSNKKLPKFCSNDTIAQIYLTQILSLINDLQNNSSYNSILKLQSANFITYLKDTTNHGLLHSNCDDFIKGLQVAKKADKAIERAQRQLAKTVQQKIKRVARSLTDGKGFYELNN